MDTVAIISSGLGNVGSIRRMLEKAGGSADVLDEPGGLSRYRKIILPGVGHFDNGMRRLNELGFAEELIRLSSDKDVKVLGICLGMQLLCKSSEEGVAGGLGVVNATVERLKIPDSQSLKVPHMGWNTIKVVKETPLFKYATEEQRFYFVHSFRVMPANEAITIALCKYGDHFCAAFQDQNIFGVQFHPEKSHKFGLHLIKRFLEA